MTPAQTQAFKAMATAIVSQAEQINRLTDSVLRLHERLEKVENHPGVSVPPLEAVPA